ncbi:RpnC/YadD family protein [Methylohalobius crimeensis]|uniref:transposase n=1 Tax=Methylohalobius crimeensis TaxID=244365 RepID=UPI000415C231|nr:transposase [Methylohalobius crimeensis]
MATFAERFTQEGIQKGVQQGIAAERDLLLRLVQKRFGEPCARRAAPLLEAVTDPDRLAEIGEWILDAEDEGTFLRRLEEF